MHVHSHTLALLWMTKAGSITTATWKDRASGEGRLRPERLVMQWERALQGVLARVSKREKKA